MSRKEAKRSSFFSKAMPSVCGQAKVRHNHRLPQCSSLVPGLPGAHPHSAWYWALKKISIFSYMLSWHFILFLAIMPTSEWQVFQCILEVLISSRSPSQRPYHTPISLRFTLAHCSQLPRAPGLSSLSWLAHLQSFPEATRSPAPGKQLSFRNGRRFCYF